MHKLSVISAALLAVASSAALGANEVSTFDPVLVTATRLDVTNLPASVTVIDKKNIAASPAQTLPDLLELEAGITARSLYGNSAARDTVDLRGFGATGVQNTLILVDGRRLNDIDLSHIDFAAIPLGNIERIEIIRGSGAVLYGDGAVGGAINIVTRTPVAREARGNIRLGAGSYDTRTVDAAGSSSGKGYGFNVFGNSIVSEGYRSNNALTQNNMQADARFRWSADEVFAKLGAETQDLRLPGARTVDPNAFGGPVDELNDDRRGTSTPNDYSTLDGHMLTAGWRHTFVPERELIVDSGYRTKVQTINSEPFMSYVESELSTWSFTPRYRGIHSLFGGRTSLAAGVDHYSSQYDSDRAASLVDIGTPIHRLDIEQSSAAIYGQATQAIGQSTTVLAGARLQQVHMTAKDEFDATAPGALFESRADDFDRKDTEPAFELGVRQVLTPALSAFMRAGRSVRFGTVDEVFEMACDPITFSCQRLFSPLEPQVARTGELGLDLASGGYHVGVAGYVMSLTNEIAFRPDTFTNDNLDPTRRQGATLTGTAPFARFLRVKGDYAYTRAEFRAGPFDGNDVPLVAKHTGAVTLLADILPSLSVATSARYVGARRFDNDQSNTFAMMPAYTQIDLKLTGRFDGWRMEGAVNNVLNEEAFDYGVRSTFSDVRYNAYPLPERNYSFTVARDF